MRELFITSVGTDIGKTFVTTILCHQLLQAGRKVTALKPVVSGFSAVDPRSDPVLILRSLGRLPTPDAVASIAPWRFAAPLSPHLAARRERRPLALRDIIGFCRRSQCDDSDFLLVEGAGGVMSPVDQSRTCVDLIRSLGYPTVLVTGTYLGALSHTLTALHALRGNGATVQGVVVSESLDGVGLIETMEGLWQFAGAGLPLYSLPRLSGSDEDKWRAAPPLTGLCELGNG